MTETTSRSIACSSSYFKWLYSFVGALSHRNPSRSYWLLCERLHNTIFYWMVPNDDNRIEDGVALREGFCFENDISIDVTEFYQEESPCTVFEMLVALAERMAYIADGSTSKKSVAKYVNRFLTNLDLRHYTDEYILDDIEGRLEEIDAIIKRLVYREYDYDGSGGLFPLRQPFEDQRDVELWYQMAKYIDETSPL